MICRILKFINKIIPNKIKKRLFYCKKCGRQYVVLAKRGEIKSINCFSCSLNKKIERKTLEVQNENI